MAEVKEKKLPKWHQALVEANNAFNKAPKAQKRLLILKDVLKFSKSKKVTIAQGTYGHFMHAREDYSAQENLLKVRDLKCKVCAKGALFCSRIRLGNKVEFDFAYDEVENRDTLNGLEGIFTRNELDLFELIFENGNVGMDLISDIYIKKLHRAGYTSTAGDYISKHYYPHADKRFIQMVENVIWANGNVEKGVFRYLDEDIKLKQK